MRKKVLSLRAKAIDMLTEEVAQHKANTQIEHGHVPQKRPTT